jgi:hypothetical protein
MKMYKMVTMETHLLNHFIKLFSSLRVPSPPCWILAYTINFYCLSCVNLVMLDPGLYNRFLLSLMCELGFVESGFLNLS